MKKFLLLTFFGILFHFGEIAHGQESAIGIEFKKLEKLIQDEEYSEAVKRLERIDITKWVADEIKRKQPNFIGTMELDVQVLGLPKQAQLFVEKEFELAIFPGISDVIESGTGSWYSTALDFSCDYNRLLYYELSRIEKAPAIQPNLEHLRTSLKIPSKVWEQIPITTRLELQIQHIEVEDMRFRIVELEQQLRSLVTAIDHDKPPQSQQELAPNKKRK